MLRGMVSSIMGRVAGDDPATLQAMRDNPETMQRMADPRVVLAMESINLDPKKLLDYQDDPEVMELLETVARMAGGSSYAVQRRLEEAELMAAEGDLEALEDSDFERAAEAEDDGEALATRTEARRRFAEVQRLRSERARREVAARSVPLTYDIQDWASKPWYERSHTMGMKLQEKGFCILRGSLDAEQRRKAVLEAQRLQRSGGFTRPPREVLSGLFGDIGSAWTRELSDPLQPAPKEDEVMREFDNQLEELGSEIAGVTDSCFGMKIKGRTVGVAHLSRMAEDQSNPPLVDAEEADGYMMLFMRKKVKMIYYVGPGIASMRIFPIGDTVKAYKTTLEAGTVVALRGDVCRCLIDPLASQVGLIIEVDFLATEKLGPQENVRDRVPPPEEILVWYEQRLKAIVENDVVDSVPDDWVMLARSSFYKSTKAPIDILEISHNLPATAQPAEKWTAPFAACTLGGSDCVSEIPSSKWDMSIYYDEDPMNVDNFKMYTRHLGLLEGNSEFDLAAFGLTALEASSVDPRYLKLCESSVTCLDMAGFSKDYTKGKDIGLFLGVSGNEMQYQVVTREARLSKASYANSNNATNVSRLTYLLGSIGPSVSIDTEDSSGSAALDNCATYLRMGRCFMALTGSVCLIQHPLSLIVHCAAGTISWTGRCRVFDESSDGVVRGEGVVAVLLKTRGAAASKESGVDSEAEANRQPRAMLMGSGLNSKGMSSSLTAPSGPSIHDVLQRALRDASYPACMLQGLDMNANGFNLGDTVEMGVMQKALTTATSTESTVVLRNFKSVHGEVGAPSGLASLSKAFFFLTKAVHGPCLHLHELSEILENVTEEGGDQGVVATTNFAITTECLEAANVAHHAGVNSFSTSGTNVHHIIWGIKPEEDRPTYQGPTLRWFPTCGDGAYSAVDEESEEEDGLPLLADYYIIGSWNAWDRPVKMQEESAGVYSYVIKLGENRWETFQIWLEGDKDRVLHPAWHWVSQEGSPVLGPSAQHVCGRLMTWVINGRPEKVRLINEEQLKALEETLKDSLRDSDELPEGLDIEGVNPVLTFSGGYKPSGYENAEDISGMPIMVRNSELVGVPGDLYKVRFLVSGGGRFRKVEWSKLDASHPPRLGQDFKHAYFVIGDFSFWTYSQMEAAGSGTYTARVQLLTGRTDFQIARDRDCDQAFYPKRGSAQDSTVLGPLPMDGNRNWRIEGEPGDVFLVKFARKPSGGDKDDLSISWEFVANEPKDLAAMTKDFRYYLVGGSGDDFMEQVEMKSNEDRSAFTAELSVGDSGKESFQILLHGTWLSTVHPNHKTASFRDPGHEVQGPDGRNAANAWLIGKDEEDHAEPGSRFLITLEMQEHVPRSIHWRKLEGAKGSAGADTAIVEYAEAAVQSSPGPEGRAGEDSEEEEAEEQVALEDRPEPLALANGAGPPALAEGGAAEPAALEDQGPAPGT